MTDLDLPLGTLPRPTHGIIACNRTQHVFITVDYTNHPPLRQNLTAHGITPHDRQQSASDTNSSGIPIERLDLPLGTLPSKT